MLGFRVWDIENKKFENWNRHFLNKDGDLYELYVTQGLDLSCKDRFIPMQSTGIMDCNGVEIFEGDVLEVYKKDNLYLVKDTVSFLKIFGCWEDSMQEGEDMQCHLMICGNIYENPDLLERLK